MAKRRLKVFISYARIDQTKAYDLYKHLSRYTMIDVWIDKERILSGQAWEHEISKQIRESDIVIVCHSTQFDQKGFRQKEVRMALRESELHPKGQIFIIPVRFENCKVLDDLVHLDWVDLFDNPPFASAEDGYEKLLRSLRRRAQDIGAVLRAKRKQSPKVFPSRLHLDNAASVPNDLIVHWLIRNDIVANPFRIIDIDNYQLYPEGVVRPNQWDSLFDPVPLHAHCPTAEDARALLYLLKRECLQVEEDNLVGTVNRQIFPVLVWPHETISLRPFVTVAYSAARTWLNIILAKPRVLLDLPRMEQNTLLELLCWSLGSNTVLINLIHDKTKSKNKTNSILIQKIANFNSVVPFLPHDDVLVSWLKIRPFGLKQTYVIFSGDDLFRIAPTWQPEHFGSLVSALFSHGIMTRVFSSSSSLIFPSLHDVKLSWPEQWLKLSIVGQFDAAMCSLERSAGKSIRFHDLFGPGVIEQETTDKLISASHNSLARMLMLGNRLLQYHCEKHGVFEKYLYVEDLETILKNT
ncbi:MAG: toll/interleukin-1 receptor domain-containing protein [Chloroflexota bacterium]